MRREPPENVARGVGPEPTRFSSPLCISLPAQPAHRS